MRWNGKRVLITGSMGIIGRALVNRLVSESAQVLSVDIKPINWSDNSIKHVQADLSKVIPDECVSFGPEVIFHLAATFERTIESPGYWKTSFDNNVLASHRLLEKVSSLDSLKLFVFASSYLIYDPKLYLGATKVCGLKEADPIAPRNLVGLAKYFTERELSFLEDTERQFRAVSARIFRVYGRGSRDVISRWVRAGLRGERIEVWGKDSQFDYIYADDVAEGLIKLAESQNAEGIVNLGSGRSRSIGEVIDILRQEIGTLQINEIASDIQRESSQADMSLFNEITGWVPSTTLEEGIQQIVEYERKLVRYGK